MWDIAVPLYKLMLCLQQKFQFNLDHLRRRRRGRLSHHDEPTHRKNCRKIEALAKRWRRKGFGNVDHIRCWAGDVTASLFFLWTPLFLEGQDLGTALNKGGNFYANASAVTVVLSAFLFKYCHSGRQKPTVYENRSQTWILRTCQEMLSGRQMIT